MTLYVLDTDHVSLAQCGHPHVAARIAVTPPEQLTVNIVTVQEQLRGRLAQVQHAPNTAALILAYQRLHETLTPSPDCMASVQGPCDFSSDHFPLFTKCGKMGQAFRRLEERKMPHAQVVCTIKYRQASAAKGNMGGPAPTLTRCSKYPPMKTRDQVVKSET